MYTFDLVGKPQAQSRPRFAKGKCYNSNSKQKKDCRIQIMSQIRDQGLISVVNGPIAVEMWFYFKFPKKTNQTTLKRVFKETKPDIDNLSKFYLDAMNKLIFEDDAQVVEINCKKYYYHEEKTIICVRRV